jgi:hypothetical protein
MGTEILMTRRLAALTFALLLVTLPVSGATAQEEKSNETPTTSRPTVSAPEKRSGTAQTTRPQPTPISGQHRHGEPSGRWFGLTKSDVLVIGAIAGTSMGVGAIVAGAKGVAIGAAIGGAGGYLVHRIRNR